MKTCFYHTAGFCQPCKRLKPMAKRIADEMGATFIEVDIEVQQPILPEIASIPTVVIYGPDSGEPEATLTPSMLTAYSLRKVLTNG